MSTVADPSSGFSQRAAFPPLPVCRFTVNQYEAMIRAGIITEDDPIELLDGWMVPQMTQHSPHILASELVERAISRVLPVGWCYHSQRPLRLAASMPEPNLMVIRGDLRSYGDRLARAEDVGASHRSIRHEPLLRSGRQEVHLRPSGHPCYWLVNLIDGRIEEYTDPAASGETSDYRQRRDYSIGGEIALSLDGRHIADVAVRDLLP